MTSTQCCVFLASNIPTSNVCRYFFDYVSVNSVVQFIVAQKKFKQWIYLQYFGDSTYKHHKCTHDTSSYYRVLHSLITGSWPIDGYNNEGGSRIYHFHVYEILWHVTNVVSCWQAILWHQMFGFFLWLYVETFKIANLAWPTTNFTIDIFKIVLRLGGASQRHLWHISHSGDSHGLIISSKLIDGYKLENESRTYHLINKNWSCGQESINHDHAIQLVSMYTIAIIFTLQGRDTDRPNRILIMKLSLNNN